MSTYFKIHCGSGLDAQWSQMRHVYKNRTRAVGYSALLAVAQANSSVAIYNDKGEPYDPKNEQIIKNIRGSPAAKLCWHPHHMMLAVGWKDGAISIWGLSSKRILGEDSKTHRQQVCQIVWSKEGHRLVTADVSGRVAVWKLDNQQRPHPLMSYDVTRGNISNIIVEEQGGSSTSSVLQFSFLAAKDGKTAFHRADDQGHRGTLFEIDGEDILSIQYLQDTNHVVTVTKDGIVTVRNADKSGQWVVQQTMKFQSEHNISKGGVSCAWLSPTVLAIASSTETKIQVYDFELHDNYQYNLMELSEQGFIRSTDNISHVAYSARGQYILVITTTGQCAHLYNIPNESNNDQSTGNTGETAGFRAVQANSAKGQSIISTQSANSANMHECWCCEPMQPLPITGLVDTVQRVLPGPTHRQYALKVESDIYIVQNNKNKSSFMSGRLAYQVAPKTVVTKSVQQWTPYPWTTCQHPISNLGLFDDKLALITDKATHLYLDTGSSYKLASSIADVGRVATIQGDSVYKGVGGVLQVLSAKGTVKHTIHMGENKSNITHVVTNGDHLTVVTDDLSIRLYRVKGRTPKEIGGVGRIDINTPNGAGIPTVNSQGAVPVQEGNPNDRQKRQFYPTVDQVCMNSDGTIAAITFQRCKGVSADSLADGSAGGYDDVTHCVYFYIFEQDKTLKYNMVQNQGCYPINVAWDYGYERVVCVDASPDDPYQQLQYKRQLVIMYVSAEYGCVVQDTQPMGQLQSLVGVGAPFYYTALLPLAKQKDVMKPFAVIQRFSLNGFEGLENIDATTKLALLNFSYYLAIGKEDDAQKAIRAIHNPQVWESMAHVCIKTKRLDIAELAIGHMEHLMAAKSLRETQNESIDTRVGFISLNLGMYSEAESLFREAGRLDLLSQLYAARGEWDKVLQTQNNNPGIQQQVLIYQYAKHLEFEGQYEEAVKQYELADAGIQEICRMYVDCGDMTSLQAYLEAKNTPEAHTWWARFHESRADPDKALSHYQLAQNTLQIVRLHCNIGQLDIARQLVTSTQDPAAAFHLARVLDAQGEVEIAMQMYNLAGKGSHAVRLARQNGLNRELFSLAINQGERVKVEAAEYFEECGLAENAVTLYQSAGQGQRALQLATRFGLGDMIASIAADIGGEQDAAQLESTADVIYRNGDYAQSVKVYVQCAKYVKALEVCYEHGVIVDEELAEALTPSTEEMSKEERLEIIKKIGKVCKHQGHYQLACKKYAQAGDKVKAMKALTQGGDTEKIMVFANVSRNAQIYLIAANYLQTLKWHTNADIMKAIISYYQKAKAHSSLAIFFEACAQMEIDECRDYTKALAALKESLKYTNLIQSPDRDHKLESINFKLGLVAKFVKAQGYIQQQQVDKALNVCEEILESFSEYDDNFDSILRVGDVYALMVEQFVDQKNYRDAHAAIQKMRSQGIALGPFLDEEDVIQIYKATGLDGQALTEVLEEIRNKHIEEDNEIQEEIPIF